MMNEEHITLAAANLVERAKKSDIKIALAESCTGGMVAAAITDIPGASQVLACGFVVYSDEAKEKLLGVKSSTLKTHGAVSKETAIEMAEGALNAAPSGSEQPSLAVSITGIAGPGGGTADKPVGLVWFAVAKRNGGTTTKTHNFCGNRQSVRINAAQVAISELVAAL